MNYLKIAENIDLINNVSLDVNNKLYYNFVVESDRRILRSDSTNININDLLDDKQMLNINKLNETCIITPNKIITNFKYIPIFHRNGTEKKSETEVIVHFSILIDMLTKVFSDFKHLILKLSDIVLNLTELQDNDLETYMNMTTSEYIKLLKEKDKELLELKQDITDREEYIETLEEDLEDTINYYEDNNDLYEDKIDLLMKEIKEINHRFDEQTRQHQQTIEELRNNNFEAEQRHIETMNELRLDHAYTVASIDEHSKTNLNNTAKRCGSEAAKELQIQLKILKNTL